MALFKIFGNFASGNTTLPTSATQGFCYFDKNTGKFYIDTTNAVSGRMALNAEKETQQNQNASEDYRILLSGNANDTTEIAYINKNTNLRFNPGTQLLSVGGSISTTGDLTITGVTQLNGQAYANSLTAGSLIVNGNTNFVQIPTAPTPASDSNDTSVATTAFVKNAGGAYLPLSGGTMSGGVTFVGNQSSAWNSEGILFTKGSRIGENTSGQLGLYSADKFYLRPNSGTASSGKGVEISTTSLVPSVNNEMTLGDSNYRWVNVYSTKYSTITQSAGYTNGIRFVNGSTDMGSIGCDNTGILGIYAKSKITLRPVVNTATDGVEITTTSMIPTKDNTVSLGDSTHKWSNIYGVGSNITALNASNISTGTLALARLAATSAHYVLAGPSSGTATATPAFRALVADDIPISSWAKASSKPSYTASEVGAATASHTHGNLSNDGKITTTATINSGDKLVIVDSDSTAASKITGSSITFGTNANYALANDGTWQEFNNYTVEVVRLI